MQNNINRFIGLDVHKESATFVILSQDKKIIEQGKIEMKELGGWAKAKLNDQDRIVLEATGNCFMVRDVLKPYAGEITVANALAMHDRTRARKKTDKNDAYYLAEALACNYVAEVWIPPMEVREKRSLATHRRSISKQLVGLQNQMRAILYQHGIKYARSILSDDAVKFVKEQTKLSENAKGMFLSKWRIGKALVEEAKELDRALAEEALQDEDSRILMSMPGVRAQAANIILSAIGDIKRFESDRKLASYSGLVPSVCISGDSGGCRNITKQGRSLLRWIMTEAAQAAVKARGPLQEFYRHLIGKGKKPQVAIVALARKMLMIIWHMLRERKPFNAVSREALAFKLRTVYNRAFGPCPNRVATTLADEILGSVKSYTVEA